MKKSPFKETVGVVVSPVLNLNFGQTVDVLDETSIPMSVFIITPHGEQGLVSVPKSSIKLYDASDEVSPCILNPRFNL